LHILQKKEQHIATGNDSFFSNKKTFNLICAINYLMQVTYHFCSKNKIPSRHKHIQPFPVKSRKNAN